MNRAEKATENFKNGCNCAQAVLAAYADLMGLDEKDALRLGAGLGGGVGRMREVCGAFNAAAIVIGAVSGGEDLSTAARREIYEKVRKAADEFKKTNRSIICRELLGIENGARESAKPDERTAEYYRKRPCADIVADAARAVETILSQEKL